MVKLASPEKIRSWSFGEVKIPDTVKFGSFKPVKGGLFCKDIFGPIRILDCLRCRYKGKRTGISCDSCKFRDKQEFSDQRFGNIELSMPIVNYWFQTKLSELFYTLIDLSEITVEKVLTYKGYIVLNPGSYKCEFKDILDPKQLDEIKRSSPDRIRFSLGMNDEQIRLLLEDYKNRPMLPMIGIGPDAIYWLLNVVDTETISGELSDKIRLLSTSSNEDKIRLQEKVSLIDAFEELDNKPELIMLSNIPVSPISLRAITPKGVWYDSPKLNQLYAQVIRINNRLASFSDSAQVLIRSTRKELQTSVNMLFDHLDRMLCDELQKLRQTPEDIMVTTRIRHILMALGIDAEDNSFFYNWIENAITIYPHQS